MKHDHVNHNGPLICLKDHEDIGGDADALHGGDVGTVDYFNIEFVLGIFKVFQAFVA